MSKINDYGFDLLMSSISERPLARWSKIISLDGSIKRVIDELLNGDQVIEITGKSVRSNCKDSIPTSLNYPSNNTNFIQSKLPIIVFILRNLRQEGKIELQLLDQQNFRRKFVLITNTSREKIPKVTPNIVFLPFYLDDDWNILEIDLRNLCREVYSTNYQCLQRLHVHPNFRLRRIYMQNRHYENNETPKDLYEAITELAILKKNIEHQDKNCQTFQNKDTIIPLKSIAMPIKKKRKKKQDITNK